MLEKIRRKYLALFFSLCFMLYSSTTPMEGREEPNGPIDR